MDESFLAELAKPQPDPGGGAAAAYGALVGLALAEKVCLIELRRTVEDKRNAEFWDALRDSIEELSTDLTALRMEDSRVYDRLSRAGRLHAGGQEVAAALIQAVECPKRIAQRSLDALNAAVQAGTRCRRHLTSDVLVACELLVAAIRAACHIARANALLMENADDRSRWLKELDLLREDANQRHASALRQLDT